MRILIIEDDAAIADAIVAALTRAGHAVDRLSGGRQADAALQAHPYDLIVLDLGLPEMDGVELLKRLRARADAVPVLVATAREELIGIRASRQLSALEVRHARSDADQRLAMLAKDNELQSARLQAQAVQRRFGAIALAGLALALLALIWRYRGVRRLNRARYAREKILIRGRLRRNGQTCSRGFSASLARAGVPA